jgi:hypothetical protein
MNRFVVNDKHTAPDKASNFDKRFIEQESWRVSDAL